MGSGGARPGVLWPGPRLAAPPVRAGLPARPLPPGPPLRSRGRRLRVARRSPGFCTGDFCTGGLWPDRWPPPFCAPRFAGMAGFGGAEVRAPRDACARSASARRRSAAPASPSRPPVPLPVTTQPRPGRPAIDRCTASSARLAVDFTVPRLMPVASAISASDIPP